MIKKVALIGSGAWGTTIAKVLGDSGHEVRLWCHVDTLVADINSTHQNAHVLPGIGLAETVVATSSLEEAVTGSDVVIIALASPYLSLVESLKPYMASQPVLSLTKGLLDKPDALFVSDYLKKVLSGYSISILSGPNIAKEIAQGLPAASVIASQDLESSDLFQHILSNSKFRMYTASDVKGVELGGVLKNIYALGAGICDALELGHNAKSAYISRALKEMVVFGTRFGAEEHTFYGLSGLGDLVTTCMSPSSRNWRTGRELVLQGSLQMALGSLGGMVAEGVNTTKVVHRLALEEELELPLAQVLYRILFESLNPKHAIVDLMGRNLTSE